MPNSEKEIIRVDLGKVVITPRAVSRLFNDDVIFSLGRHLAGDWGEVSSQDWDDNNESLRLGRGIRSSYTDRHMTRFWIITEADRSRTSILLPEEY